MIFDSWPPIGTGTVLWLEPQTSQRLLAYDVYLAASETGQVWRYGRGARNKAEGMEHEYTFKWDLNGIQWDLMGLKQNSG